MSNDLQIARKVVSKGREFYVEGDYGVPNVLKVCSDAGYQALFMPELAMARADADKDSRLWQAWFLAPSVRVTGKSKAGYPVVVYAHVPTSLSDPANIRRLIDDKALVNGAGPMPEEEFYTLLDQEGNGRIFVVDYAKLRESTEVIEVDDALSHPQIIPFLGREQTAQAYLTKHKDVYGNRIGVWYSNDLNDRPMGRVLCLGSYGYVDGLHGFDMGGNNGRFVGVAPEAHVAQNLEGRLKFLQGGRAVKLDGVTYINPNGKAFRHGGRVYIPVTDERVTLAE